MNMSINKDDEIKRQREQKLHDENICFDRSEFGWNFYLNLFYVHHLMCNIKYFYFIHFVRNYLNNNLLIRCESGDA